MAMNVNGGSRNRRDLVVARSEPNAREGLLTAAGRFIEGGAVNFGDYGIVITAAVKVGGGGRGGGKGKRVEFGLGEEAEVDEWKRLDGEEVVVGG